MQPVTPFAFQSGNTSLHTLDPRCKLILTLMVSISIAAASWPGILICTLVLWICLSQISVSVTQLITGLKYFLCFLLVIMISQALMVPGQPIISGLGLCATVEGLSQGGLVAARFFLVMVLGLIFTTTTQASAINAAIQWAATPIPFIPEKTLATLFSLAVSFFPAIFLEARQTRQAIVLRCGNLEKNPFKRLVSLCLPLMTRILKSADHRTLAMEARCFSLDRTGMVFQPSGKEKPALVTGTLLCLVLILT